MKTIKQIYESTIKDLTAKYILSKKYALSHKLDRTTIFDKSTMASLDYVCTPYGIFILSIDTPKEFRGKGGASRLLQTVIKLDDTYLEADASEDNRQEDLERLYMHNGFTHLDNKIFMHKKGIK